VIDAASIFAGPMIATLLGDFGADVIKIEHPTGGDSIRKFGWQKDGVSLFWAVMGRNKRSVTAKLSDPRGAEILKRLVANADVLIENFRTGTMERWGLGWDVLHELNPKLVMVRTTGFGQTGPYRKRAGFGTLAEAMSGFAQINGFPDGPPTLPSFALADSVAALAGAFATMAALRWRDHSGVGQVIDLSIYEPLFWILGPHATVYDQLGVVQERTGNRTLFSSPRNAYLARDGVWLAVSGSSQSIAERLVQLVGRPELVEEPWFVNHDGRLAHQDELDEAIGDWIAERDSAEVIAAFEDQEAAIAPVLSIAEIFDDPQFIARETITEVDHPVLGPVKMQNVIARLSDTPGVIRSPAPELGEHNASVLRDDLGYTEDQLADLSDAGVIAPIVGGEREPG
jgi:crotonobetainyl-CoA:carnitine CoA-transferase CaiB-like acyl-CoA transferase